MKRTLTLLLVSLFALCLSACTPWQKVPKGYINAEEHFDTERFQDYTDYCKYYYQDKSAVEKDARAFKTIRTIASITIRTNRRLKRTRDTAVFQKRILPPSAITLRIFGRRQLQM